MKFEMNYSTVPGNDMHAGHLNISYCIHLKCCNKRNIEKATVHHTDAIKQKALSISNVLECSFIFHGQKGAEAQ